jgi:hypothetical protein
VGRYIHAARHGSIEHARAIVRHVHLAEKKKPLDRRIETYLMECRDKYERQPKKNLAAALGLVRESRGNPNLDTEDLYSRLCEFVQQLQVEGDTEVAAVKAAATAFAKNEQTVRRAVSARKKRQKDSEDAGIGFGDDGEDALIELDFEGETYLWSVGFARVLKKLAAGEYPWPRGTPPAVQAESKDEAKRLLQSLELPLEQYRLKQSRPEHQPVRRRVQRSK